VRGQPVGSGGRVGATVVLVVLVVLVLVVLGIVVVGIVVLVVVGLGTVVPGIVVVGLVVLVVLRLVLVVPRLVLVVVAVDPIVKCAAPLFQCLSGPQFGAKIPISTVYVPLGWPAGTDQAGRLPAEVYTSMSTSALDALALNTDAVIVTVAPVATDAGETLALVVYPPEVTDCD